ncbi:ParB N-terminal domain-containing protein [Trinickia caryophylli]|uniref:ParB-like nuclease domain-containing protein n=1 Tax=Trinickia caryophylli TaxID=28094 RepID=A0A1X7D4T1_TRICW|nr:ParB N-terminal domain-containing protein [Trinickia caryophylli]PMS12729.1 transcriptional regulator [Trinickia caryophylli]TRX15136.1 transcriptional regulator [Trinickia caryophylli]WQE15000.1 ParB N-terminal domain-containing protein [Trinickia caryophylli]SMF08950.1 ParB-like nuclease domain-containing protein [Trinickia caryophylli]GLU31271.1 hypothetical protein Busp01_11130 [Trinickia caryophylli]
MPTDFSYCIAVKPISFLQASEVVDENHVSELAAVIREAGRWTTPIPIDTETGIVMDGNHRLRAAAMLGLSYLPCVLLDYLDPRVSVTHWRTGEPFCVKSIGTRLLRDKMLFPYKTTRHRFASVLPHTDIPLALLSARG